MTATLLVAAACGGSPTTSESAASTAPAVTSTTASPSPESTAVPTSAPTTSAAPTTAAPTTAAPPTTEPPAVPGEAWQRVDLAFFPAAVAVVGDRLWVAGADDDQNITLASSLDGVTWNTVDLPAKGLPTDSPLPGVGVIRGQLDLASDGEVLYGAIAAPAQPEASADGVGADIWVLTTAGAADGDVVLLDPAVTGIDQRLAGPDSFRISGLAGMTVTDGGNVHLAAEGQWWRPFETSDADFAVVSLVGDPPWTTFSENREPVFRPRGVTSVGDTVVAVGEEGSRPRLLASRVSTDGVTWTDGGAAPPDGEWLAVADIAAGSDRVVAVGNERSSWDSLDSEFGVAWVSTDGIEWQRVVLPDNGEERAPIPSAVGWDGSRFLAFATMRGQATDTIWTSADGLTWDLLSATTYPGFRVGDVVRWGDRLVAIGTSVAFSPPLD